MSVTEVPGPVRLSPSVLAGGLVDRLRRPAQTPFLDVLKGDNGDVRRQALDLNISEAEMTQVYMEIKPFPLEKQVSMLTGRYVYTEIRAAFETRGAFETAGKAVQDRLIARAEQKARYMLAEASERSGQVSRHKLDAMIESGMSDGLWYSLNFLESRGEGGAIPPPPKPPTMLMAQSMISDDESSLRAPDFDAVVDKILEKGFAAYAREEYIRKLREKIKMEFLSEMGLSERDFEKL